MAIEIKRTPVLKGKAAADFMATLQKAETKMTAKGIRTSILQAKKILSAYKSGK